MLNDAMPEYCRKPVLIIGCGNILFGDDGFGCAVVEHLQAHSETPDHVYLADAGTGVRKMLFTLCLTPLPSRRILIVDAVDAGREPGEWFEINPSEIPVVKLDDFSMHQVPTSNLLREIQEQTGAEVRVLVCQTGPLPAEISPGLSAPVERAITPAAAWIVQEYFTETRAEDAQPSIELPAA